MRYAHLLVIAAALSTTPSAISQQSNNPSLPIAVDGAQTPDRIPDVLAYRHFMTLAAQHRTPSASEIALRNAVLLRIGLSSDDQVHFVATLVGIREQLENIEQSRRGLSTDSESGRSALATLKANMERLLDGTSATLKASLSANGAMRVDLFVKEHVKRHIKIYGTAQ